MTDWTRNADIRSRLEKRWNRGDFLAMGVQSPPFEPLRVSLKHPTAAEIGRKFSEVRAWINHLVRHAGPDKRKGYIIEWREINHRTLGRNKLPVAVTFQTIEDIYLYLGKTKEAEAYRSLFAYITGRFPELAGILTKKPHEVLKYGAVWSELLAIVTFLKKNPRPMIYIRQLDMPGVHTKFVETHKAWLTRLLTEVLSEGAVDQTVAASSSFEKRFGFLPKPDRIRFRILDPALSIMGLTDLQVPGDQFHDLPISPRIVFVTENEINGLSFPPVPDALVVFGLGYSVSALSGAPWIDQTNLWYWGDIDTHGFAMLDRLRHHFPHARSFLMDEDTLMSHKDLWGSEPSPVHRNLPLLTIDEAKIYDALCGDRYAPALRLEQERISYAHVIQSIGKVKKNHGVYS